MIEIISIEASDKEKIKEIVNIHLKTFEGFFLTFMGKGFLTKMYLSYCEHNYSELTAALENGKVLGFLAYSKDMSSLYKFMIKKHLLSFAWYSLGAFFRKPKVFMRLLRAFLKPKETQRVDKYIELASIGVLPEEKSKGVGTELINNLKSKIDFNEYDYITLETDAINNDAANSFYLKNGFVLEKEYFTHEGRKMNEYRFCAESSEKNNEYALHT